MQTFDQAVYDLYKAGEISYEEALRNADSTNEVRLMIKLGSESGELPEDSDMPGLSIESDDDGTIGRI
jgi:twitching motility protein PilU